MRPPTGCEDVEVSDPEDLKVGFVPPFEALGSDLDARRRMADATAAAGIDHLGMVDHVSFRDGQGYDGLIHASSLLTLHRALGVYLGLYLLPLRHPMTVARQLATISQLAPGRLTFAVGIGGEDRSEVSNCGVDPATRGRRMDEHLAALRLLLAGGEVDYEGEFVELHKALIVPSPSPAVPIIVGGRSDVAHTRAARLGDGWLGLWVSAARFAQIVESIREQAAGFGRAHEVGHFAMSVWVGLDDDPGRARSYLADGMKSTYGLDFDTFERWCPCGTPAQIAEFLSPYVEAGCTTFNLMPRARDLETVIEGVGEIRRLLGGHDPSGP